MKLTSLIALAAVANANMFEENFDLMELKGDHKREHNGEHKRDHKRGEGKGPRPCMAVAKKKCEGKGKECFKKVVPACRKAMKEKLMKNPCAAKIAKGCKDAENPRQCFWPKFKKVCKKEDKGDEEWETLEVEELEKKDGKHVKFCKAMIAKSGEKCEGHEKECMAKCLKVASSPCVQKVAKVCKGSKAPKKCFLEGVKKCKKDSTDDELEELKGKGGKPCPKKVKACKAKVMKWCGKDEKCMKSKFKWCMSQKKEDKEDDLEELEGKGGKPCPKRVAACKKKVAGWCGKDKQCWEKKFKWCMSQKKEDKEDDLEELEGGKPCPKKVAACKKKVAGWCGKDKQCWEKKFKWCMSHGKKEDKEELFLF